MLRGVVDREGPAVDEEHHRRRPGLNYGLDEWILRADQIQ